MNNLIIVDDEAAGRKLIREYLAGYPSFNILGEAENGVQAVELINSQKPDLIFLDIQMPEMNGFEVLTQLDEIPQVIFSTAYDQYALKAFEVHAVDYLLKPYTKSRFQLAMERVLDQKNETAIASLANKFMWDQPNFPDRILIHSGRKLVSIRVPEITWIEADGDYSKLYVDKNTYLSNFGISKLAEKLDPSLFIRVHRSSIINLNAIVSVDKYNNSFQVLLSNGAKVRVSRGYADNIKRIIF